ncbi:MAG: hypothetical protein R3F61_37360 [Myxococcota bacterium]
MSMSQVGQPLVVFVAGGASVFGSGMLVLLVLTAPWSWSSGSGDVSAGDFVSSGQMYVEVDKP